MYVVIDMAVVAPNRRDSNFWGLTIQRGPWAETPADVARRNARFRPHTATGLGRGGTRHAGHANYEVMVNPHVVRSQKDPPVISTIAAMNLVTPERMGQKMGPGSRKMRNPKARGSMVSKSGRYTKDSPDPPNYPFDWGKDLPPPDSGIAPTQPRGVLNEQRAIRKYQQGGNPESILYSLLGSVSSGMFDKDYQYLFPQGVPTLGAYASPPQAEEYEVNSSAFTRDKKTRPKDHEVFSEGIENPLAEKKSRRNKAVLKN